MNAQELHVAFKKVQKTYDGVNLVVKAPNASDHKTLKIGEKIRVGWMIRDCRALKPL